MRRLQLALFALVALAALAAHPALAVTARDLSARIRIDGFTNDFTDDEKIFTTNAITGLPQEASDDSKWGTNEDLNQIRISWDAKNLYIAGEGTIWDNNMILFIDSTPNRGLQSMTNLNSWRRNFTFDTTSVSGDGGFSPDLFGATWDGNPTPHLVVQLSGSQVDDELSGGFFVAAATFNKGTPGRSMELAIPWRSVFLKQAGLGTRDTVITVAGVQDTFFLFPRGTKLKICGVVTAGADGTGGPDAAPDNLRGMSNDANANEFLDNYALIDLDRNDDTGIGNGGPDGVADWGVEPLSRVTFRYDLPITPIRFALDRVDVDRPAFAPDRGERIHFSPVLNRRLDPSSAIDRLRQVNVTANVFDLRGNFIKNIVINSQRAALTPADPAVDYWDGRDERGVLVPPGIYIIRCVLEPNLSRQTRAFVVVR